MISYFLGNCNTNLEQQGEDVLDQDIGVSQLVGDDETLKHSKM